MLGLLLIFFLGKWFYSLAEKYNKHKWGFAILGVVTYYVGTFIAGIFIGIISVVANLDSLLALPDVVLGLIALPFGVLAAWGLYKILENNWKKHEIENPADQLLDDQLGDI